jgi:broad specificity polyphosphatase/5'/3'-nucleotidase SurE
MNEMSGSNYNKKLLNINISTCILTCEKRIYFTNSLKHKMGKDSKIGNDEYSNRYNSSIFQNKLISGGN